jgi:hypothetical protein
VPVCANCGHDNPERTQHCLECGVALGRVSSPDAHPEEVVDDPASAGGSSATDRAQHPADRARVEVTTEPERQLSDEELAQQARSADPESPDPDAER